MAFISSFVTDQLFRIEFEHYQYEQNLLRDSTAYLNKQLPDQKNKPVVYLCTGQYRNIPQEDMRLLEVNTSNKLYKALYNHIVFLPDCIEFTELPNATLEWAAGTSDFFPVHTPQQTMHIHLAHADCDYYAIPTEEMVAAARLMRIQTKPYPSEQCIWETDSFIILNVG